MKAIQIRKFGGVEVLEYRDVTDPVLTNNSVLIEVEANGVNFADTYIRSGTFPVTQPLPHVLGMEGCGKVIAISQNQDEHLLGTRVAFYQRGGAYAEQVLINLDNPENFIAPVSGELPLEIAASLSTACLTAYLIVERLARGATEGKLALVHGASGAVGTIVSQLLKLKKIKVIGIISDDIKKDKVYCDYIINRKNQDISAEVKKLSATGVDYVFNSSGGHSLQRDMKLLSPRGEIMWFGFAESKGTNEMAEALSECFMKGYGFYTHVTALYSREERTLAVQKLAELFITKKITLEIKSLPLIQAAQAHQWIVDGRHSGKIVLTR